MLFEHYQAFVPKALNNYQTKAGLLTRSLLRPSHSPEADSDRRFQKHNWAYSSGNCTGFTPVSRFKPFIWPDEIWHLCLLQKYKKTNLINASGRQYLRKQEDGRLEEQKSGRILHGEINQFHPLGTECLWMVEKYFSTSDLLFVRNSYLYRSIFWPKTPFLTWKRFSKS